MDYAIDLSRAERKQLSDIVTPLASDLTSKLIPMAKGNEREVVRLLASFWGNVAQVRAGQERMCNLNRKLAQDVRQLEDLTGVSLWNDFWELNSGATPYEHQVSQEVFTD